MSERDPRTDPGRDPAPAPDPAPKPPEAPAPGLEPAAGAPEAEAPRGPATSEGRSEAPDSPPIDPPAAALPGLTGEPAEPVAAPPAVPRLRGWLDALVEPPEATVEVPRRRLAAQSRRDFLMWGAGVAATLAGAWWLLPDRARSRLAAGDPWLDTLAARVGLSRARRERLLDRALTFDDDVAEALYSKDRRVRTYSRSEVTALRNNYHGRTPGPEFLPGWRLEISGLAAGNIERLTLEDLARRLAMREQVTRLVCVEGWSAIAWWGGIRFADLIEAFPPTPGARWAALRSEVSLDSSGRSEPYYVSIDLGTARHPQTLLASHHAGAPLTLAHGAPLRLIAPMKLGLKNIKAITHVAYTADEPADYWNELGYSRYDGL